MTGLPKERSLWSSQTGIDRIRKAHANRIKSLFGLWAREKYGLVLLPDPENQPEEANDFRLLFQCSREVPIDEARELCVTSVQEFVRQANNDEKLRPHLVHYPITEKDVEIAVAFHSPEKGLILFPSVTLLGYQEETIRFEREIYRRPNDIIETHMHTEIWEDAVRVVRMVKNAKNAALTQKSRTS